MKTLHVIISFLAFSVFLNSCYHDELYPIDDKLRIEYYDNDIFIYQGGFGNIDTLQVWEVNDFYVPYSLIGGQIDDKYEEFIVVTFNKINIPQQPNYLKIEQFYDIDSKSIKQYVLSENVTNPVFIWTKRDKQGLISYKYNNETFTLIEHIPYN